MTAFVAAPQMDEAPPAAPADPFDSEDLQEFGHDDGDAASTIGKMLSAFFFYSLLAMAFVAWVAFQWVSQPGGPQPQAHQSADH